MKLKPAIVAIVVLALLAGVGIWIYPRLMGYGSRHAVNQRMLATRGLAEYLTQKGLGKKALVLSNPFTQQKGHPQHIYDYEAAGVDGLRQGFGKTIVLEAIEYPEIRAEWLKNPGSVRIDPQSTTPLSFLVAEKSFDTLSQKHPDCDLVVSLIGLPTDITQLALWRNSKSPKLVLLLPDLRMVGGKESIREAFKSGKIAAAVLNTPGAPAEGIGLTGNRQTDFDQRFLLLTAETIDEAMKTYPQLF